MVLIGQFHLCNSLVFVFFLFCHTHIGLYQFSRRKTTLPIVFTHPRHCQNCTPAFWICNQRRGRGWGRENGCPVNQATVSQHRPSQSLHLPCISPSATDSSPGCQEKDHFEGEKCVKEEKTLKSSFLWAFHGLSRLFSFLSVHEASVQPDKHLPEPESRLRSWKQIGILIYISKGNTTLRMIWKWS